MSKEPRLIIPVYLNQRMVFDLVAMLEGGIATVKRVSETEREVHQAAGEISGIFGLNKVLASLLRVDLSGKIQGQAEGSVARNSEIERVHTPASLLYMLRRHLVEQKILQVTSLNELPKPGELVEFVASLKKNPLIEGLDCLVKLLEMTLVFQDKPKPAHEKGASSFAAQDLKKISNQFCTLSTSLKVGDTQDLIANVESADFRAVLTVEDQFLNDPSLSDLVDGTFHVIGKVIRSIPEPTGSISLLRKTALSLAPTKIVETIKAALGNLNEEHGFVMPPMEDKVQGPVFQLLPIAVYA